MLHGNLLTTNQKVGSSSLFRRAIGKGCIRVCLDTTFFHLIYYLFLILNFFTSLTSFMSPLG